MDLTLNFVSSICWEIISNQIIRCEPGTLPVFRTLLDSIYDFSPAMREHNFDVFWQYSPGDFLKIEDHFSFCTFLNLMTGPNLYLVIPDAEKFYTDTEKYLKILDLMELKVEKEKKKDKYDLTSVSEKINEQIKICKESSYASLSALPDVDSEKKILRFALRKMSVGRCYTADICSGYSLIDCVRKGWPKTKRILVPLPDEVIERKIKKDPKSKSEKDKKDKNDSKSKAKTDKKEKTDKKSKK